MLFGALWKRFVFWGAVLSIVTTGVTADRHNHRRRLCALEEEITLHETLVLTQRILDEDNAVEMELTYQGIGWLGFGFSQNGRMVGSTVIVGFPDEPMEPEVNPGKFYLANKAVSEIIPLPATAQEATDRNATLTFPTYPSDVPSDKPSDIPTSVPTMMPVLATAPPMESVTPTPTLVPTPIPSRAPIVAPVTSIVAPPTSRPTRVPTPRPTRAPVRPTAAPTPRPTRVPTPRPTRAPVRPTPAPTRPAPVIAAPTSSSSATEKPPAPLFIPGGANWRRMLLPDLTGDRTLAGVRDAKLLQNETHTVLRFVRPLHYEETDIVFLEQDMGLNTFIYAAGRDNQFSFHAVYGSKPMIFSPCPHVGDEQNHDEGHDHEGEEDQGHDEHDHKEEDHGHDHDHDHGEEKDVNDEHDGHDHEGDDHSHSHDHDEAAKTEESVVATVTVGVVTSSSAVAYPGMFCLMILVWLGF